MSKTFSPRDAGPGAWKTWHKDSLRTLGRLGPINMGIFCTIVITIGIGAAHISSGTVLFLVMAPVMQCLGVLFMIFCQHLIGQAAEGERASFLKAGAMAWVEIQTNPEWVLRRFFGQLMATGIFFVFSAFLFLLASSMADPEAAGQTSSSSSFLTQATTMVVFMAAFPVILQRRGAMYFSYWLGLKHGMKREMVDHHQEMAVQKNQVSISFANLTLLLTYMTVSLIPFPLVSIILLAAFLPYHAAYTRCAYHDIFEDGTGLKEKEKAEEGDSSLVPVLQA